MVTSSVTSSRLAPAWSGHFTLLSGAAKSCIPDRLSRQFLTTSGSPATLGPPGSWPETGLRHFSPRSTPNGRRARFGGRWRRDCPVNQAELLQYVVETLEELGIDYMIGLKRRPLFQTGRACF